MKELLAGKTISYNDLFKDFESRLHWILKRELSVLFPPSFSKNSLFFVRLIYSFLNVCKDSLLKPSRSEILLVGRL